MTATSTTITNVRIFDSSGLTDLRSLVIEDGRITSKTTSNNAIDGQGGTLLPGFIDCHIHLTAADNLRQAAHWGVTTMLDMGTPSPQLVASLRKLPSLTDIRSSQSPASGPGSVQTTKLGFPGSTVVSGPHDAEKFVRARVAEGADYIKIIAEDPNVSSAALDVPTLSSLVQAAHAHGLRTFAHVTTGRAFEMAIEAGVDVLTHTPLKAPLENALAARMSAQKILAVPTLVKEKFMAQAGNLDYHNAELSVMQMYKAGVPVLAGTDAYIGPGFPFQVKHGESFHDELSLLVAAGLTPIEALHAATTLPAQLLSLEDRGVIQEGKRADLLLVEGDPTTDIGATRAIRAIWIAGERVR